MKWSAAIKIFFALLLLFSTINSQSGGTFEITQSVVAGGGAQQMNGGTFSIDGTTGQAIAGDLLTGWRFSATSGFWNYSPSSPTAANVTVSGRVLTLGGNGIRNVFVTMTSRDGSSQTTVTGSFGIFQFENIQVGETYIFTVFPNRFTFSQPTQLRAVFGDLSDVNFYANE